MISLNIVSTKNKKILDLIVSDKCNLNCDFCYLKNYKFKSKIRYDKYIKVIEDINPDIVVFLAKEALLSNIDYLIKIIDSFPDKEFKLYTNLTISLSDKMIELIKKCTKLETSFDVKYRFKNIKNLNRWIHNCKYIINTLNKDLCVGIVPTTEAIKIEPNKYTKLFRKIGFKNYSLSMLEDSPGTNIKELHNYSKEELIKWMRKFFLEEDSSELITSIYYRGLFNQLKYYIEIDECGNKIDFINGDTEFSKFKTSCLMCDNFKLCGGTIKNRQCYFDKDLYDLGMKLLKERNYKLE